MDYLNPITAQSIAPIIFIKDRNLLEWKKDISTLKTLYFAFILSMNQFTAANKLYFLTCAFRLFMNWCLFHLYFWINIFFFPFMLCVHFDRLRSDFSFVLSTTTWLEVWIAKEIHNEMRNMAKSYSSFSFTRTKSLKRCLKNPPKILHSFTQKSFKNP